MRIGVLAQYEFHVPNSGGKAGKGHNVTGSVQVRQGQMIVKQFRFKVADRESGRRATRRALQWARDHA